MLSVVVDYIQIVNAIAKQFQIVYSELMANYQVAAQIEEANRTEKQQQDFLVGEQLKNIGFLEISDEQSFTKKENKSIKTCYIVVKFGVGTSNFASSVSPVSVLCVGTPNRVKPAQILLSAFAARWTTLNMLQDEVDSEGQSIEISDALQVWNTPEVVTNFNETNSEFRNLFRLNGTLVIGQQAVRLGTLTYVYDIGLFDPYRQYIANGGNPDTYPYDKGFEKMNIMSFEDNFGNSLDPQPFGHTHGFTKSEVNFSTYTFSFSTYLLSGHLSSDITAMKGFRKRDGGTGVASTIKPNHTFTLILEFTNGYNNYPNYGETSDITDEIMGDYDLSKFKLVNSKVSQELGNLASMVLSFSR